MAMIDEYLKEDVFAVVGASPNSEKYGYKIYKHLQSLGKKVYPVHPAAKEIDGEAVYKSLTDIPDKVAVVDIVVPPQVTERVVEECLNLGITKVWIQPGAESDKAIEFCEKNNMEVVHHQCIMMPDHKF